jgi:hypothetical protein
MTTVSSSDDGPSSTSAPAYLGPAISRERPRQHRRSGDMEVVPPFRSSLRKAGGKPSHDPDTSGASLADLQGMALVPPAVDPDLPDAADVDLPDLTDAVETLAGSGSGLDVHWVEEEAVPAYLESWEEPGKEASDPVELVGENSLSGGREVEVEPVGTGPDADRWDSADVRARELALRLEEIAVALRRHGPSGALRQRPTDPLSALIIGYLLGSAENRDRS